MTKNDKILLVCCFIVGCIVTAFISGCSKPKTVTYNPIKIEEETTEESLMENKFVVYTGLSETNQPIKIGTCQGCHFACPHCVEE